MSSYSFPETSSVDDEFSTHVLFSEARKQFLGWVRPGLCYGWTSKPEVTVVGGCSLTPISAARAESYLAEARRWRDDVDDAKVVEVVMSRDPHDINRWNWRFAS